MSEQEQVPQGSIPPKASPFSKPEGASPVAPGAPRPITVRLKPVAPAAATPAEPAEPLASTPLASIPRMTARVPIPELPPADAASVVLPPVPGTVRLRPVIKPATEPVSAARPAQPGHAEAFRTLDVTNLPPASSPLHPVHPPTPGSHPLPEGPKPPSSAQVQAAKSKTSRISLDSAIGVAPMSPMGAEKSEPKTIRLKRPVDLAAPTPKPKVSTAPIRQTSRIPDSVLPTAEAAAAEAASVTQKKTLKIRRPGAKEEGAAAAAAAGDEGFPEGVTLTPLGSIDYPSQQESGVFTKIALVAAVLAIFVLGAVVWSLLAHSMGPDYGRNSLASVPGTVLPWANKID